MKFNVVKGRKGLQLGELEIFVTDKEQLEYSSRKALERHLVLQWNSAAEEKGFAVDGSFNVEVQGDLLRCGVHYRVVAFVKKK